MFKEISERVANLILQNEEQMEKDWEQCRKQAEAPEACKFPVSIKFTLTNKDGKSKKAHVTIEWSVNAKRQLELDIEDNDHQDNLPME